MAACVPSSPSYPSLLDAISKSRWDEKFDDTLLTNTLAGNEEELDLGLEVTHPAEADPYGWEGGYGLVDDVPWATAEDWSQDVHPSLKTESLPSSHAGFGEDVGNLVHTVPPTLTSHGSDAPRTTEADLQAQPDDEGQEVSFDWNEDTPNIVWYSPCRKDGEEHESAEVEGEHEGEEEDEDNNSGEDSDASESDSDDDVEGAEEFCGPVLPGATPDDGGEEEEDGTVNDEDFVHILVSDPPVTLTNACASPAPQYEWSPHQTENHIVDEAPAPSLKSRLRQQKRRRSDEGSGDDDGDDSGDYGEPIHRPRKKTRPAFSPPPLGCDTASPSPESETPSASDPPGRHNEGGMTMYRVCKQPRLPCGFPGCKKILSQSDHKSFKEARGHYRKHFKNKDGSWAKNTLVTCNWSGCTETFTLGDVQCNRHLQEAHFEMKYECPHCKFQTHRQDIFKKHLKIHEPSKCRGGRRRGQRRE